MSLILVIEDNADNLELMTYLLKAFGHTTLTALDGEEGMRIALKETPDLIVCDVQIPKLSGYEVAQQLKSHPVLRTIPLIAVTALAMVGDRDKVLAAGFDGYIAKPINPETFVTQVEEFLQTGQRPSVQQSVPSVATEPPARPATRATILVVDNSSVNLELVRSTFEPFGYQVIPANGAQEALTFAQQTPPDLILSDVHMPGQDGYALIKAVKTHAQLKTIPFVFISSTVWRDGDAAAGLALGAVKFILRPIEPQALLDAIQECLGNQR